MVASFKPSATENMKGSETSRCSQSELLFPLPHISSDVGTNVLIEFTVCKCVFVSNILISFFFCPKLNFSFLKMLWGVAEMLFMEPYFGLLVTSALGFKARMDPSLVCCLACTQ